MKFTRVVSRGRNFIPEVDGLRFVAITAVVLYHLRDITLGHLSAPPQGKVAVFLAELLGFGNYGVQLFFVLSGFLLAIPFAKWRLNLGKQPSLRTYYLRRLTRLEPPYVVALLLLFAAGAMIHSVAGGTKWPSLSNWPNLLASLIYQHNLIFGEASLVTPVVWSLEIEVQFYLLAPLLAVAFSIPRTAIRRVVFLAFIIGFPFLRALLPVWWGVRFNGLPWYLEYFATGFLLADLFLVDWKESPVRSYAWDIATVVGWITLGSLMLSGSWPALLAPAVLLSYCGAFRGKLSSWLLSRSVITTIGGMCYSIYLLHYTIELVIGVATRKLPLGDEFLTRFGAEALINSVVVLVVCGAFFATLERPCMDPAWPSRLMQRFGSARE